MAVKLTKADVMKMGKDTHEFVLGVAPLSEKLKGEKTEDVIKQFKTEDVLSHLNREEIEAYLKKDQKKKRK